MPNSTISIVPATGELKNLLPKTSQKVNIASENKIKPDAIWPHNQIFYLF